MTPHKERLTIIDDDAAVLDSLRLLLEADRYEVQCFRSAEAFLADANARSNSACVISDVRMPGLTGLDLQRELAGQKITVPLILITGHGDISMAVKAVKAGAYDFLEKPLDEERLLESITAAVDGVRRSRQEGEAVAEFRRRVAELSERQRQVMELAVVGLPNKEIAQQLGISPRTVETYRAWVMEKTGARNFAELVRMAMLVEQHGKEPN
jgi:two-component system response regulator FixJ